MRDPGTREFPEGLLADVRDALERADCAFEFCKGPTLEPVDMVTCYRCATLAEVRAFMGDPPTLPEEMPEAVAAYKAKAERRYITGGGPSRDGCTTLVWSV